MNILSIHTGHDCNVTLLKNDEILFYLKEERFSRKKRDTNSLSLVKKIFKNFKEPIDYFIISSINAINAPESEINEYVTDFLINKCRINEDKILILTESHHTCHSFISFLNSGFSECISLVIDGGGAIYDNAMIECESIFYHSHNEDKNIIKLQKNLYKTFFHGSRLYKDPKLSLNKIKNQLNCECIYGGKVGGIVPLYCTSSFLVGESPLENGKVMGLSSYGEKIKDFPALFLNNTQKVKEEFFDIDYENFKLLYKPYKDKTTKKITKENYKFYADYAYEIQTQTQESVGNLIEKVIKKTGIKNICISGGYGMNVVANYYYLQRFPDVNFYFEPLSDDSSISIGAAKLFYYNQKKDKTAKPLKTTSFHGFYYDISQYKGKTTPIKEIAKLLHENKSVSVYTGLAEAGQRALGNRSILFNALNPDAKNLVNKIKKREWYRPFACMVLEEDANQYFDMGRIKSSPFMTTCFPVRSEYVKVIPGVIHVDNTCRIQTVSESDGYLYKCLKEFKKLSGHGVILNTSFNLAGEPLVETPEDAFKTLNNSCLDYLWFEETQQLFKNKNIVELNYQ